MIETKISLKRLKTRPPIVLDISAEIKEEIDQHNDAKIAKK